MTNEEYDAGLRERYGCFCGVDEAGRGPLAGPVCAAAVILDPARPIPGINDSKKLSEKKAGAAVCAICAQAAAYAVAFASVEEIEQYNILQATFLAMTRAVSALEIQPQMAVIDGNRLPAGAAGAGRYACQGRCLVSFDRRGLRAGEGQP